MAAVVDGDAEYGARTLKPGQFIGIKASIAQAAGVVLRDIERRPIGGDGIAIRGELIARGIDIGCR